jgi:hypothetical protein
MGLIKTAIMSGAAMYTVNKLAKTAQAHQSNTGYASPSPPILHRSDDRRFSGYRDYEEDRYHNLPHRQVQDDRSFDSQGYAQQDAWGIPNRDTSANHFNPPPPPHRHYFDGNPTDQPNTTYSHQERKIPQRYQYAPGAPSAPPTYEYYDSRQRGFSEQVKAQNEKM